MRGARWKVLRGGPKFKTEGTWVEIEMNCGNNIVIDFCLNRGWSDPFKSLITYSPLFIRVIPSVTRFSLVTVKFLVSLSSCWDRLSTWEPKRGKLVSDSVLRGGFSPPRGGITRRFPFSLQNVIEVGIPTDRGRVSTGPSSPTLLTTRRSVGLDRSFSPLRQPTLTSRGRVTPVSPPTKNYDPVIPPMLTLPRKRSWREPTTKRYQRPRPL